MNLCFVTYQFKTGGVERVFCALARELAEHNIKLITVTSNYDVMLENIPSNVEIINIHNWRVFRMLSSAKSWLPFLSSLITPLYLILEIICVRCSRKFSNTTFINFSDTISSILLSYYGSHQKKIYSWLHFNPLTINSSRFKKLYHYVYRRFYKIICICNEQLKLMSSTVPGVDNEKLTVVYNILDYNEMIRLSEQPVDFDSDYIVMVARFDKRSKDFETLIKAYTDLPEEIKNTYKLVFVGDGPDLSEVKNGLHDNKEKRNICFVGMQENPYKWIRNATILVHSSKTEGLPTVLLEALACKTPVISTMCQTGPKEILNHGEAGILVPVGDDKSMNEAMELLLTNEELRNKYIDNGTKQLANFSKEVILDKINTLWKA